VGPKFDHPILKSTTELEISGQFDTHANVIGDVIVGFMIIPEKPGALNDPIVGEAKLTHGLLTTSADSANPDVSVTGGTFSTIVGNRYDLVVGDAVRVIGLSVAVKAPEPPVGSDPQDPPGFETYTWCVNRTVVAPPTTP